MGFFDTSSSSSSTTTVKDYRVGSEGDAGAISLGSASTGNIVNITNSSDDVAISAIESAYEGSSNALTESTDFLSETFTNVLSLLDRSEERAQANVLAATELAESIIDETTEDTNDQLIQLVKVGLIAAVIVFGIQSGYLKDLMGALK